MRLLYPLILSTLVACSTNSKTAQNNSKANQAFTPDFNSPGPPVMIYKTKKDYSKNVAVILSDDKSQILSYPAPTDVSGKLPLPTNLKKGYLLDNRGINQNVAFLKMTYEEYAKQAKAPAINELYANILDKDPLTEICNCGNRNALKDPEKEINSLIKAKTLRTTCKAIK